jgi:hypothetical protein
LAPGGSFQIEITATGPWSIVVADGVEPSPSPALPAGPLEIVLQLEGTGHDVSPPFEVVSGWQIQWQADGDSLAIAVTGDEHLGIVVNEAGPASGVISQPQAGTFRLDIVARGPWSITVIQGEEPATSPT